MWCSQAQFKSLHHAYLCLSSVLMILGEKGKVTGGGGAQKKELTLM